MSKWTCRIYFYGALVPLKAALEKVGPKVKCKKHAYNLCFVVFCCGLVRGGYTGIPLQWRHNGHNGISNHQLHDCLLNRLFRRRSKKTSKLRVTGLCAGKSPLTGEFPAQMASNAASASIWWRHNVLHWYCGNNWSSADEATLKNISEYIMFIHLNTYISENGKLGVPQNAVITISEATRTVNDSFRFSVK